jgi:hypothetical protein
MGIVAVRYRGRLNLCHRRNKDHSHYVPHPTEMVWLVSKSCRELNGIHLSVEPAFGSWSHSEDVGDGVRRGYRSRGARIKRINEVWGSGSSGHVCIAAGEQGLLIGSGWDVVIHQVG